MATRLGLLELAGVSSALDHSVPTSCLAVFSLPKPRKRTLKLLTPPSFLQQEARLLLALGS